MTTMEAALAEIHAESFAWALACCRRDRLVAEEVLQVAYVKLLDGSARHDGGSSFKTFLFGVIRNTARERARAQWRSAQRIAGWLASRPAPGAVLDPEALTIRTERASALHDALRRLSGRQRDVLQLVFAHDLTIEQAAGVIGIGTGSARRHYERGKARLRALLRDESRR